MTVKTTLLSDRDMFNIAKCASVRKTVASTVVQQHTQPPFRTLVGYFNVRILYWDINLPLVTCDEIHNFKDNTVFYT